MEQDKFDAIRGLEVFRNRGGTITIRNLSEFGEELPNGEMILVHDIQVEWLVNKLVEVQKGA